MRLQWRVTAADIKGIKKLISEQRNNALVRLRIDKNCSPRKQRITKARFWQQMVCMRLTSQQNSSPHGPVGRFAREKPFPLKYSTVVRSGNTQSFIRGTLKDWGGIRFVPSIATQLSSNLMLLERSEWDRTLKECNRLTKNVTVEVEKEVAEYIRVNFLGFGPKQSRNLLQALNLTRHEIPIDSRLTSWLNEFGFPVHLNAAALADPNYYNFVSEGIQRLCEKSRVAPCVLDAAIFTLKDGDAWTVDNAF
jgi:hypothetical protein